MPLQPVMDLEEGVVLSIGLISNDDRCEIVLPMCNDNNVIIQAQVNRDAVDAAIAHVLPLLVAILSSDTYVSFVQSEGIQLGTIPYRTDFAAADWPGTRASGSVPSQVAALMTFYAEPTDLSGTEKMRAGKNFIPGLAAVDITGDKVSLTVTALILALGQALLTGYATDSGTGKWYRIVSTTPRTGHPTEPVRCDAIIARRVVATQRRRLLPH